MMPDFQDGTSSLGEKAQSAVIWNAGFNMFRDLLQFAVMLVLVRLLAPEAYGQFSLVTSIIGFMGIFSFNNFIAHSLQVKTEEEANLQQHFTVGAALQLGLFVITNVLALLLRWVPKYTPIAPLIHVMSLTFLLEWPCEVRRKMLERQFDWGTLRILHGIGFLANAILAIVMGLAGAASLALLVPGLMVTVPFIYDLFVRQHWRPNWAWSWKAYEPAWEFGVTRIGSGLVLKGRQLLESGVLSGVLGFATLGILNRSFGLAQLFCYKVATQLIYAIYPLLTRVGGGVDNEQRVGGLVLRTVAWTVLPTAVCFGVLAGPAVETVYGTNWIEVVPLLPWAMGWGAVAALVHAAYMLLLSRQQPKKCFIAEALTLGSTALCLCFVLPYGTVAYLVGVFCVQAVILALLVIWLHAIQAVSWRGIADALLPATLGAVVAALGTKTLLRFAFGIDPDNFWHAVEWGVIFLALYLGILRLGFVKQLSALVYYFPARGTICRVLALKFSL